MGFLKKIRWFYLLSSLAIIGVGILLICSPDFVISTMGYIAGAALMIFGIAKVVSHFFNRASFVDAMLVGVLLAMFGFVIIRCQLSNVGVVMDNIYTFIGILILLDGVFKLKNAFQSRSARQKDWIGVLVTALVVMVFGILIVANPFGTVQVTIIMLGVSVLIDGVQNLYSVIRFMVYGGKKPAPETPETPGNKPELDAHGNAPVVVDGRVEED